MVHDDCIVYLHFEKPEPDAIHGIDLIDASGVW
jgi:hypothetical protein